ncbi:hypothetical protein GCM10027535_18900 [Mycolicibacterium hippocampi]|uniref:Uncharacterized protein n=1 Tax=Mycolicibacterium hippocampi TaxID=659824 RepID=A0A7I9ZHW0_9MYCO|nr:hypothetical protein MHIP_09090 [Mycolicibacterium hippocampi]
MKLLASDARKTAAAANSSGLPIRFMGFDARSSSMAWRWSGSDSSSMRPGVKMGPGTMVLTRNPRSPNSVAQVRPKDRMADGHSCRQSDLPSSVVIRPIPTPLPGVLLPVVSAKAAITMRRVAAPAESFVNAD